MPVYHSVVVEADGKSNGSEKAKTLYIIPKDKTNKPGPKRCGTFAKVLAGATMALLFLFLVASLGQYLYEKFGPEPEPETYENTKQFQKDGRSEAARLISSKFTIQIIAAVLLFVLAKFVWGEDK